MHVRNPKWHATSGQLGCGVRDSGGIVRTMQRTAWGVRLDGTLSVPIIMILVLKYVAGSEGPEWALDEK